MADPHHVPDLDGFDRLTIVLYRAGLGVAAVGLAWTAAALLAGRSPSATWFVAWLGAVLCAGNLHLYDKRVRWVIGWLAWSALLVRAAAPLADPALLGVLAALGNGLVLASLSGVVLKEWFCFRLPLVQLTPLALAVGVIARFLGADGLAGVALGLGALGVAAVAVAKARMPLGHDLGDRGRYQV